MLWYPIETPKLVCLAGNLAHRPAKRGVAKHVLLSAAATKFQLIIVFQRLLKTDNRVKCLDDFTGSAIFSV